MASFAQRFFLNSLYYLNPVRETGVFTVINEVVIHIQPKIHQSVDGYKKGHVLFSLQSFASFAIYLIVPSVSLNNRCATANFKIIIIIFKVGSIKQFCTELWCV